MRKFKKILVPDILPNNLRIIRDMRGLSLKEVADALKIDRNFLSAVEVENKNFSGKTTIRALKFYEISFYKMYDVKEKRVTNVTDYFDNIFRTTLSFDPKDLLNGDFKLSDEEYMKNIINVALTEELEQLKENNLIINSINKIAKKSKVKGTYEKFDLIGSSYKDNKLYLDLEVTFKEKRTEELEFDINFVINENLQLADMLRYRGFPEVIRVIEKDIDGEVIRIEGNVVHLDKPYKLPKGDNIKKFAEKDTIDLSDKNLKIKYSEETNEPISIKFKAIKPDMNNLKAIRTLTNISIEEMHKSLGLTYNGYINLELGNQKISTKVMWRLVNKLNVPLELILNIDEYYEKYCDVSVKVKDIEDDEK
jgi:transcriptional regulator with XRE-family HTH domain